jgi:hypothetical protein
MGADGNGRQRLAVLVEDLYFLSSITSAAGKAGVQLAVVKPGDPVPEDSRVALLDLQYRGWEGLIRPLVNRGGEVIAFGPHVDGALMRRARAAGCSRVMAKSKFVRELPRIMAGLSSTDEARDSEHSA